MIAIGSDHAGFALKEQVKEHLQSRGIEFQDFGTDSAASCHYVDYAKKVAESVASGECEKGILVCGTGVGMSMAANKVKGIRAACVSDTFSATQQRKCTLLRRARGWRWARFYAGGCVFGHAV